MDTALNTLLENPDKPSLRLCFKHDSWQRQTSSKEKPRTSGGPSHPQCIIPKFTTVPHAILNTACCINYFIQMDFHQKLPFHLKKLQKYKIHYILCVCNHLPNIMLVRCMPPSSSQPTMTVQALCPVHPYSRSSWVFRTAK